MLSAADRLKAELGIKEDVKPKAITPKTTNDGESLFSRANAVNVADVLAWLGLMDGEQPICPGCRENDKGVAIYKNGLKCQHDRCDEKGANDGFRTPVDLVMEAKGMSATNAALAICDHYGIEVPRLRDRNGGEAQSAPPVIEIMDHAAIFAPLEEPDYIVESVIRRSSVNELVAYGQSGKTWLAFDMVIAVALGFEWLGRFACKEGRALFLDYEAGSYECRRRIQAIAGARGFSTVEGVELASMPSLYMTSAGFEAGMLRTCEGRDLVVIDSLRAASPGVDENDSNIRTSLDTLRRVGEKTGTAFLVLVHAKKVSGSATAIDPREAGRGSSAIFDAADTVYHLHYRENAPLLLQQTKARLGRQIDPFQVEIVDATMGGVSVMASALPKEADSGKRFDDLCDRVLEVVRAQPNISARLVFERVSGRYNAVKAALEHLELNGAVKNVGDKNAGKWIPVNR